MKKTASKQSEKLQLPVSKKFYGELRERVIDVCENVLANPERVGDIMVVLDSYLHCGTTPDTSANWDTLIVFTLLRHEMDRALRRSASARQRARKRREEIRKPDDTSMKTPEETPEATPKAGLAQHDSEEKGNGMTEEIAENEELPHFPMNRRQRRLIEQERKRQSRKQAKKDSLKTNHPDACLRQIGLVKYS